MKALYNDKTNFRMKLKKRLNMPRENYLQDNPCKIGPFNVEWILKDALYGQVGKC